MEPEPVVWVCDWCGGEFAPDPECMVESGFSVDWETEEGELWMGEGEPPPTWETAPPEMLAQMKEEMGLDDEQVKRLIETGGVNTGYECICKKCHEENDENELESGFD